MTVTREQIAELFHDHIRLVVRPDQINEPSPLWCVKPASKEAFLDAVMTLLAEPAPVGAPATAASSDPDAPLPIGVMMPDDEAPAAEGPKQEVG